MKKTYSTNNNVYKAIEESLNQVKLIKKGKIKPKTWRELLKEIG